MGLRRGTVMTVDPITLQPYVVKKVVGISSIRPPPPVQRTILSFKNTVRTEVFVGHTVRCARQYCEKAVTHLYAQDT